MANKLKLYLDRVNPDKAKNQHNKSNIILKMDIIYSFIKLICYNCIFKSDL